jgi:hypothetical protein
MKARRCIRFPPLASFVAVPYQKIIGLSLATWLKARFTAVGGTSIFRTTKQHHVFIGSIFIMTRVISSSGL